MRSYEKLVRDNERLARDKEDLSRKVKDLNKCYRNSQRELENARNENKSLKERLENSVPADKIEQILLESIDHTLTSCFEYEGHPVFIVDLDYNIGYANPFANEHYDFNNDFREIVENKRQLPNLKKENKQEKLRQEPLVNITYKDGTNMGTLFVPIEVSGINNVQAYTIKIFEPSYHPQDNNQ